MTRPGCVRCGADGDARRSPCEIGARAREKDVWHGN